MGLIHLLSENVINKIAAGEVVERPASVVKELVENSLDAGAQTITVTVKHGGKALIRVTDDGHGMDADDAQAALQRHATSKITSVEDIFRVQSFGFRGEALPSIAAVCRMDLKTRKQDEVAGTALSVEGGRIISVRESGASPGTTVEARDLFFNTPARKKFLRSERAEYLAIADVLTTFALGNPNVHFCLLHDRKQAVDYPSCTTLMERIRHLFDKDVIDALIPLAGTIQEIGITGFITDTSVSRVNRTGQYFFVNHRPIKSPALSFALQQGYENLLPPKRHCLAFLFLAIDHGRVDVNVHPNKREVRVANEREVQKLLVDVVRETLHVQRGFSRMGSISMERPWQHPEKPPWKPSVLPCQRGVESAAEVREPQSPFTRSDDRNSNRLSSPQQLMLERDAISPIRVIAQFEATYILAECEETLFIIDQHAAHERIVYEKLLERFETNRTPSQRQLIPVTFSVDYREQEVLDAWLPQLEKIGFGINNLGRNTYSLDAAPSLLADEDLKELIRDVIHQMMEWQQSTAMEDKHKALAAAVACKQKTVKAASRLSREAMDQLVKDLFQTKQPYYCPHGRPTCITLTVHDLEQRFGRA